MKFQKGQMIQGRRSKKVFKISGYTKSVWGYVIYHLEAEDGETRNVADFVINRKYTIEK